jgi:hypothetical protein
VETLVAGALNTTPAQPAPQLTRKNTTFKQLLNEGQDLRSNTSGTAA